MMEKSTDDYIYNFLEIKYLFFHVYLQLLIFNIFISYF